jgi:DNA-binding protein H-NS
MKKEQEKRKEEAKVTKYTIEDLINKFNTNKEVLKKRGLKTCADGKSN